MEDDFNALLNEEFPREQVKWNAKLADKINEVEDFSVINKMAVKLTNYL